MNTWKLKLKKNSAIYSHGKENEIFSYKSDRTCIGSELKVAKC